MKRIISLLFLLLIFCLGVMRAQTNDYLYLSLDTGNGLSHSNVTAICSDGRGILWIGTVYGLNCYDGYQMKSYFHKHEEPFSLPGNRIDMIVEDREGTIWVATNKGLVRYDRMKDSFIPPFSNVNVSVFSSQETEERILFGGDGLYKYSFNNNTFEEIHLQLSLGKSLHIIGIHEWSKGVVLLVLNDGTVWEFNELNKEVKPSVYQSSPISVLTSYLDSSRNLYLSAYQSGLYIYGNDGKLKKQLNSKTTPQVYDAIMDLEEKDGVLMASTDGGGIYLIKMDDYNQVSVLRHTSGDSNSLPSNSITCLFKDKLQNIWVGSVRDGAIEIKKTLTRTYKDAPLGVPYGLSNKAIISTCQDQTGKIWIGTDGGGVNLFNPENDTFKHYSSTYNQKVVSIVEYSPSELLISCFNNGLYRFDKSSGKCTPFIIVDTATNYSLCQNSSLVLVYQISGNRFLILAGRMPYLYNKTTNEFSLLKPLEFSERFSLLQLIRCSGNIAYLSQGNHILQADLNRCEMSKFYDVADDEKVEVVNCDRNGMFWIGTDRGLRCLNPETKEYRKIETSLFQRVSAIQSDNDNQLWIGAQNMLFSYDTSKGIFTIWGEPTDYFPNELSNVNQPPSFKQYIYLSGIHGMIRINKGLAQDSESQMDIQLADVMLDGISLRDHGEIKEKVKIPWDYKTFQIRIKYLGKNEYRRNFYRYTVKHGNESQNIDSYTPVLPINLLSPGEYSIAVSFYTQNGTWSNPKQIIDFVITPPWYKDIRLILFVLVFCSVVAFWQVHVAIKRKERKVKWKMNKVIQKNNQERIQFLLNVSHELRTPLTLIYSPLNKILAKLEQNGISSEEQSYIKASLISVHNAANRMKSIINMTLDMSKFSYSGDQLHVRTHMIDKWIHDVVEQFKYEFEDKSISLHVQIDDLVTVAVFDDNKCGMVLSNLLMNALKFSSVNSEIRITAALTSTGVRICVIDQGIGLKNIEPEKLFTRFNQGNHNELGTGIGLAYSKMIIQKHGGVIGAFNNSDRGATFYFELPLKIEKEADSEAFDKALCASKMPSLPDDNEKSIKLSEYTLLIVEDNDYLLTFLANSLKAGYKDIYVASDGEKAWELMTHQMPDIVVSDVMMPNIGGYELCHRIKTSDMFSHIPVILLTALSDVNSTSAGYKSGANAYLSKPFDIEVLQELLCSQLRNRELMKKRYREKFISAVGQQPKQVESRDEEFLMKLNKLILDNLSSTEMNVAFLAEGMGMSRTPLYTKLKALTNLSINDYVNRIKIEKGAELLLQTDLTISEISTMVGFEYHRYFSTLFKQLKGMTPSQYRQKE